MDSVTATAAASPLASSQVTEAYNWGGRQRAQFDADTDAQAKAIGTDKIQLGFKDVLDLVNPLQHLPVISELYQSATGDNTMKPAIKTVGDTIYGGPIGAVSSVIDNIMTAAGGKDMVTTAANWVGIGDDSTPQPAATQTATANTAAPVTATATPIQTANAQTTPTVASPAATARPFAMVSTASLPAPAPTDGDNAQTAAAPAPVPNSPLFNSLQKGAAPEGQVINTAGAQKFFNPTANRFSGVTPASFKPSKDIANTPASIGLQANMQANDLMQAAAKSSNDAVNNGMAQAGNHLSSNASADTTGNPQSDFAQKMLAAMDRYEAAQKTGTDSSAPAVSAGL
jgi:hypothetical protein